MQVTWLGSTAVYTDQERQEMAVLPAHEAAVLHLLKATFDLTSGETKNPLEIEGLKPREPAGSLTTTGQHGDGVPRPGTPVVYTDPEDIPFGPSTSSSHTVNEDVRPKIPRKDQVIVLRWTWNKGRVCKTKKLAARKMKAWRRWHIRQGWKVQGSVSGDGLIAWNGEDRHAITLRVYAKRAEKLF